MNFVCYVMVLWANYFLYEMKLIKKNININFFNCIEKKLISLMYLMQ